MGESHPTSFELEASHAEGGLGSLEPHLAGCGACRAALDSLEHERAAFLAARPAGPFVRRVRQQVEDELRQADGARWRMLQLAPLGALFAILLLGHVWPFPDGPRMSVAERQREPRAPASGAAPSERALPEAAPMHAPDVVAKGSGGPALIVRREKSQFLAQGVATVQPGDELRLRFELSQPGRVEAGILMTNGEWVSFFSDDFAAGQHTPEATLRVDDEPSSGTLLLGEPAEVSRARAGAPAAAVQKLSIEWKPLR